MTEFGVPGAATLQPERVNEVYGVLMGVIPESDEALTRIRTAAEQTEFADPLERAKVAEMTTREYWRLTPDDYEKHDKTANAQTIADIPAEHIALLGHVETDEQATFALYSLKDLSRQKVQLHNSIVDAERAELAARLAKVWANSRHALRLGDMDEPRGHYRPSTGVRPPRHDKGVANAAAFGARQATTTQAPAVEIIPTDYATFFEKPRHRMPSLRSRIAKKLGSLVSRIR